MEISLALRIGMVVVGLGVLVALYLFGTRRNRNKRRFRNDGRLRQINPVDALSARHRAEEKSTILDMEISNSTDVQTGDFGLNDLDPRGYEDIGELPKIQKNPKRAKKKTKQPDKRKVSQIEMSFEDELAQAEAEEAEQPEHLLTLYVLPSGDNAFVGEFIIQSLNAVGLRFGDMDIFHHYGAGKLQTEMPLFSVANMVEPGTFDLRRIERFNTMGLVFFLQLPTALDGAVSFELFLNTAQRLTEALGGELYANPKTPLDSHLIEDMRKVAAEF